MRLLRAVVIVALLLLAGYVGYRLFSPHASSSTPGVAVFYAKPDGSTLVRYVVSVNPNATDAASVAFYATVQAVAGPPPGTPAIRFPAGTVVRSVRVSGSTATVDLGGTVDTPQEGSLGESGEFKALVWTLTALPGVSAVAIKLDGARVASLPGGHLELDDPLSRGDW